MTSYLDRYQFDQATRTLRDFVWNEFCDWYLEMVKPRLHVDSADPRARGVAQRVLVGVLDTLLRLLAPTTPFIAEELWQRLAELAPVRGVPEPGAVAESVTAAGWPEPPTDWQDAELERRFESLQEIIVAVRNVRSTYTIPYGTRLPLSVRCVEHVAVDLEAVASQFLNLANTELVAVGPVIERPGGAASFSLADADGFIDLEGVVDRDAERAKHRKELEKIEGVIAGHEKKLANENFVSRAPDEVVAGVRQTLAGLKQQADSVSEILRQLDAG